MQEVTSSINPIAPDDEKNKPEYGLRLLQAAVSKWEVGYNGESRLARKNRFDYNRSYAMAKYDMKEFKDILDLDGEYSVINLPYDCLTVVIPYLNRLKDKYAQRDEIIQCNAVDPFVQKKKKDAKDAAIFKLKQAEAIKNLISQTGVHTEEFSDNDPESEAEIDVEFGFNYKEREEVIMENLINIVFQENNWSGVIKDKLFDELRDCGYAGTKTYIDGTGRIKIKVIRPENLITSFCEFSDFRDWQYLGEAYYLSIMEVRLLYPEFVKNIGEAELYNLSQTLIGKYGNPTANLGAWDYRYITAIARPYDSWNVPIAELGFKTLYNLKKSVIKDRFGKENIVDKVTNPNANVSTLESNPYYVEYTGAYIMGTNHILEWGLSKNMIKPEKNLQEIISSYTVYMYNNTNMVNKPLMEMIIPVMKEMQLYKLQQLKIVAAAAPDGYDVDIATMSDISLDGGTTTMSPLALYEVYKQTGNKYYKSIPDEGIEGGQRRVPIQANNAPFSAKLEGLTQLYNNSLLTLTNIISNELDSGNIRNQAVTSKALEEAKATGESTSNYLYNAFLDIMQRTARCVQLRGWDILMYGKKDSVMFYDGYRQMLGTNRIEYLKVEATDDWDKTSFDIQIQTVIGDAEQAYLERNIETSLAQKAITFADAIDIRELANVNVKYASYVMAQRIAKREKEQQANQMALSQQNTQAATAGAQAKTQGELQLEQLKEQNKAAQDLRDRETQLLVEAEKFAGILKANIASAILADPTKTMADIPSFVFEGVPMQKAIDHANTINYLQTMAQANQAQQQPPSTQGSPDQSQQQPQAA